MKIGAWKIMKTLYGKERNGCEQYHASPGQNNEKRTGIGNYENSGH